MAPNQPAKNKRRMPVWAWILIGGLAIGPAFLLSPVVALLALVVLVTGIVAVTKRTPTWLRFRSRGAAAGVTAIAAAAFLVFGGVAAAVQSASEAPPADAARLLSTESSSNQKGADNRPSSKPTPTPKTTMRDEVVTEPVPFEKSTADDAVMPQGQTAVTTVGQPGERTLTYQVTLVDGVETERELVSDVITIAPITEVTSIGSYVAPPPPPPAPAPAQPAGCDSNYAEACVPVSSDVDCAGGSGNGPAYFDGVARIVGTDVYELDRDGDGYACETW